MSMNDILRLTNFDIPNTTKSTFYLSRDCINYPNDKLENVLVGNLLDSHEKIKNFKSKVWLSYNEILPQLIIFLNEYHNINKDKLFWERLIGQWLFSFISNYLEKLNRLNTVFKSTNNFKVFGIEEESYKINRSVNQYFSLIRTSEKFHLQQFSEIFKNHFPEKITFKSLDWSINSNSNSHLVKNNFSMKSRLLKSIKKLIPNAYLRGKNIIYIGLFSYFDLFKLMIKSRFSILSLEQGFSKECDYQSDLKMRSKISLDRFSFKLSSVNQDILTSSRFFIPSDYLEGFGKIYKTALNNIKLNLPKNIFTGIGFLWNSEFAIWASICSSKGTKIFGYQHGGAYGDVEIISDEFFERNNCDTYLTWGWRENKKTKPFFPPFSVNKSTIKKTSFNQVLWVTTGDSRFQYFVENIVSGEVFYNYFLTQFNLYDKLSPSLKKKILLRLYPVDFGWNHKKRWLSRFPSVKIDTLKKTFLDQIDVSDIVIIDHLGGTTALQCLNLNKPFVIIAEKKLFKIRNSAFSFHKDLNRVGILHFDIDSASDILNSIHDNIYEWWTNQERQMVLNLFKQKYSASEKNKIGRINDLFS